MKHGRFSFWVVSALLVIRSGSAVEQPACAENGASNLPNADPWETEKDSAWTSEYLAPQAAIDESSDCAASSQSEHVALLPIHAAVDAAMSNASVLRPTTSSVFVVANGANNGIWLPFDGGCLGKLATTAANRFAPDRSPRRELYLYTVAGRPVRTAADVGRGMHLLQLLIEGENWVWGGVAVGFTFRVSPREGDAGEYVTLRTASLSPRVLQVTNVLSRTTIDGLMLSKAQMRRSPEKHYAPGFENYRTSKSSFLTGSHSSHVATRHSCQAVSRLPSIVNVEWPQVDWQPVCSCPSAD